MLFILAQKCRLMYGSSHSQIVLYKGIIKKLADSGLQVSHVIFLIKRSQNMCFKVSQADRDRQPAFLIDQAHRDLIAAF